MSKMALKRAFLSTCKLIGLFHLSRRLMRRRMLILCFHGFQLSDEAAFRPMLFLRKSVLKQRLEAIKRYRFPVVTLDEALHGLGDDSLPDNALCITIDDGFYSARAEALPLLSEYRMPATLYVTSYYTKKETPIFRLVVQYMFWKSDVVNLDLSDCDWGPTAPVSLQTDNNRERVTWEIIEYGERQCDEPGRQTICSQLGEKLNLNYAKIADSRILGLLTLKELAELDSNLFDVQLHTHRHRLSTESESECRGEIRENREILQDALGVEKEHLCYPSGIWSRKQWPWLAAEGVVSATTCEPGLNTSETPPLALYRVLDQDNLSQIEFEAELFGFSEMIRTLTGKKQRRELE